MMRMIVTPARCQFLVRVMWLLYAGTLFLMTHLPVPVRLDDLVSTFDKVIHAAAFFVLGMLTLLAFPPRRSRRFPSPGLLAGLLGYAALDEYLQGFVNRTPDVRDWISDASGIVLAWGCVWGVMVWRRSTRKELLNCPARQLAATKEGRGQDSGIREEEFS